MPEVPEQGVLHGLVGHVDHRRLVGGPAGVGHEDVDAAVALDRRLDGGLARGAVLDVARDEVCGVTGLHLVERLLALVDAAPCDHDVGTLADERFRDRPPDAPRPTSDARDTSIELTHHDPLEPLVDRPADSRARLQELRQHPLGTDRPGLAPAGRHDASGGRMTTHS